MKKNLLEKIFVRLLTFNDSQHVRGNGGDNTGSLNEQQHRGSNTKKNNNKGPCMNVKRRTTTREKESNIARKGAMRKDIILECEEDNNNMQKYQKQCAKRNATS